MRKLILVAGLVAFCTMGSQNARAASDVGFKGAGVKLALVDPDNVDMAVGFGGFVDLGRVTNEIQLEPFVDYWSQTESQFGAELSVRDLAFGMRGKYNFPVSSMKVQPYAGAGLGIHMLKAQVSIEDQDLGGGLILPGYTVEDSFTRLGLDLGGGMATHLSPTTDLLAEMWYGIVSDVNQFSVRVGVEFKPSMK